MWAIGKKFIGIFNFHILLGTLALASGCVTVPRAVFYQINARQEIDQKSIDRLVWENGLDEGKAFQVSTILRTDLARINSRSSGV